MGTQCINPCHPFKYDGWRCNYHPSFTTIIYNGPRACLTDYCHRCPYHTCSSGNIQNNPGLFFVGTCKGNLCYRYGDCGTTYRNHGMLVQRVRSVQDGHDDLPRAYVVYNANLHC